MHPAGVATLACLLAATLIAPAAARAKKDGDAPAGTTASKGEAPRRRVVLSAGTLHVGLGETFSPGQVLIEDGIIRALGSSVEAPEGAERWEHPGAHVTPMLCDPRVAVSLGRGEAGRLEASLLQASDARPFDDPWLEDARERGIAALGLVPTSPGGGLQGLSAVVGTRTRRATAAPVWKEAAAVTYRLPEHVEGSASRAAARQGLAQMLEDAEAWRKERTKAQEKASRREDRPSVGRDHLGGPKPAGASAPPAPNPAQETILQVVDKKLPLFIELSRAADALAILALAETRGLTLTIAGCRGCGAIARELAESQAVVVLDPLHEPAAGTFGLEPDPTLAARLSSAGVRLAVTGGGGWPEGPQALRSAGALLASQGMTRAAAIAAMTGVAAEAAGIGERVALAKGREAHLLVWSGDPLDPRSDIARFVGPDDFEEDATPAASEGDPAAPEAPTP